MKTKKQRATQQDALFDGPRYGWKGVWEVKRGDTIVIAELETLVQSVREHEGNWYISYTHPKTGVKTEEFYTPNASVYMQLPQEGK